MNNTIASNNTQHGVYLENIRNYVIVNSSTISYNGYGAGLCVYGGAGINGFKLRMFAVMWYLL